MLTRQRESPQATSHLEDGETLLDTNAKWQRQVLIQGLTGVNTIFLEGNTFQRRHSSYILLVRIL